MIWHWCIAVLLFFTHMEMFTTSVTLRKMCPAQIIHVICRYQWKSLKFTDLEHCFSKYNVSKSPVDLVKRSKFSRSWVEPDVLHFQQTPR